MKIELRAADVGTNPSLERQVMDWAKGLRERQVAQMELYDQPNRSVPLALVVTLVDGSLYLIQRTSNKYRSTDDNFPASTIENTSPSYFNSRPVIVVTFHSHLDLRLVLSVCCSIPKFDDHKPEIDSRSFALTALLNTVRHVLLCEGPPTGKLPTETQSPLTQLWKDAYRLTRSHDYDFWEGSLLERTKNLIGELIHTAAYGALKEKLQQTESDSFRSAVYSSIARVEVLALKEISPLSPSDVAWDKFWIKHTDIKFWVRYLPLGNSTRRLPSQSDGRDLPHRYCLNEIEASNVHNGTGSIGPDWGEVTPGKACTVGTTRSSQIGNQPPSPMTGTAASNGSQPIQPPNSSCDCHVWVSDWQIAAHLAWRYIWTDAFNEGKKTTEDMLREISARSAPGASRQSAPINRPKIKLPSANADMSIVAVINLLNWMARKFNYKQVANSQPTYVDPSTSERRYQDFKAIAQQRAHRSLDGSKQPLLTARGQRLKYKNKALERASRIMDRQGGENLAEREWQKLSAGSVLKRLPEQGRVARGWKRDFQRIYKEAWSRSWEDTWLAVWDDAYQSAKSKGIEFGIEVGLEVGLKQCQGVSHHKAQLNDLMNSEAYQGVQEYIKQEKVEDILNHVRLLIQELYHISSRISVHNAYSKCVTTRALVPNKNQDVEDVARVLHKQPISRELSYMELRHFIREEYFKKTPPEHRTSFQNGVSRSWQILCKFKLDGTNQP